MTDSGPVTTPAAPASAPEALHQRLTAAAGVLAPDLDTEPSSHNASPLDGGSGSLLLGLVETVRASYDVNGLWLLLTALTGAFPTSELVLACRRHLELGSADESTSWLLRATADRAVVHGAPGRPMRIVTDQVLADVDYSARKRLLTGIQRVVRQTVPRLVRDHDVLPVGWQPGGGAFRELSDEERDYVLDWPGVDAPTPAAPGDHALVVPWRTRVLVPEVPGQDQSEALIGLARYSGNAVTLLGYDCIPAVSADLVAGPEREKFGRYLELVKHVDLVAGISESTSAEFAGFVSALRTQGLAGPSVVACPLPNITPVADGLAPLPLEGPVVLSVGSLDVRKNQVAVLQAAEQLWREGVEFTLVLVGAGGNKPRELMDLIRQLEHRRRRLVVSLHAPEEYVQRAYPTARFSVFPSLHEGFGLPIVESLSHATPVITSRYGAMREVADGQGGLLVDPESIDEIADAMRTLLTDDDLHSRLVAQARQRSARTWQDYTDDLWQLVIKAEAHR